MGRVSQQASPAHRPLRGAFVLIQGGFTRGRLPHCKALQPETSHLNPGAV